MTWTRFEFTPLGTITSANLVQVTHFSLAYIDYVRIHITRHFTILQYAYYSILNNTGGNAGGLSQNTALNLNLHAITTTLSV